MFRADIASGPTMMDARSRNAAAQGSARNAYSVIAYR
jgi:hypothetical protein